MGTGAKKKQSGVQQASKPAKKLNGGVDPSVGKKTQFKKGQSGNPAGRPEGRLSLSTHIQNLLNDDNFEAYLPDAKYGWKEFKGVPMKAIITTAITRAIAGDMKAMEWLAKYGYGSKIELDHNTGGQPIPLLATLRQGEVIDAVSSDNGSDQDSQAK